MDVQSKALRHAQHCQAPRVTAALSTLSCCHFPHVSAGSGLDQVQSACGAFINLRHTFTGVYSNAAWFLAP